MYPYQLEKNNLPLWPVCLYCKYLVTIESFTVDHFNDVYIKYHCNCQKEIKMLLQKYLYGLEIMRSISSWYLKCVDCPEPILYIALLAI